MSLIITSSHDGSAVGVQDKIDSPYMYRNNYMSGLKIPANSEIAVESVKINRSMLLDYESPITSNFWFGERLASNASHDESLSYMIPSENKIKANLSPTDFAPEFLEVLKEAYSLHPEIDTVNGISMEVKHTTGALHPFQGFNYKINQVGASATESIPPPGSEINIYNGVTYTGGVMTAGEADCYTQLRPENASGGPISLFDGQLRFDTFTGSGSWTVGLSRPIYNQALEEGTDLVIYGENNPTLRYFEDTSGLGPDNDQFYDFAVESKNGEIRLYHAVPDSTFNSNGTLVMREIIYYNKVNSSTTAANAPANTSFATNSPIPSASITDITFSVSNEIVTISASGNVISTVGDISSASFKDQVPKPVSQTCWKMYPTVGLHASGDKVSIDSYRCRTSSTIHKNTITNNWGFKSIMHADVDTVSGSGTDDNRYKVQEPWSNALNWALDVDMRPLNQRFLDVYGNSAELEEFGSAYVRPYKGLNASTMDDYEPIFITGKSDRYLTTFNQMWQPNSAEVLGFTPFSIGPLENSITVSTGQASFTSTTRPLMTSQQSTYIRVPTLNHKSHNFGTGNPSKILFQVPRFDNSGTELGALYFQNNDKSFVDLNNPSDIMITDLDVQFVRKNERFATDLTGSSEVCFFVRPKAKM
tara:strand:+ start:565 stop:2505 length:1941 start_codon:yes stop_codon:yes gene_type:complete